MLCLGSRNTQPRDSRTLWLLGLGLSVVFALVGFFWDMLFVGIALSIPIALVAVNVKLYIESRQAGVPFLIYVLRNCWFALPPVLMLAPFCYLLVMMLAAWICNKVDDWSPPPRAEVKIATSQINRWHIAAQDASVIHENQVTSVAPETRKASVVHDCATHSGKSLICPGAVLIGNPDPWPVQGKTPRLEGKSLRMEGMLLSHPQTLGHPQLRKSHSHCDSGLSSLILMLGTMLPYFFVLFIRAVTGIRIGR